MIRHTADADLQKWRAFASLLLTFAGCAESPITASAPADIPTAAVVDAPKSNLIDPGYVHRPSPQPDRIILTWAGDPSRSQAVTWRTDSSVSVGLGEIAIAEDNAQFTRRARQIKARTASLTTDLAVAHYHSIEFEALTPATKYVYRVGDGKTWSEWFRFSTASDQPEPFSFVYFGDAQNELKSMWSRVVREAFTNAPKARFLLHAGDLINNSSRDAEWGEWFQAGGWLNSMTPSVPTPGNHEYQSRGIPSSASLTDRWRPHFTLPENGPSDLAETVYYLDFQGTRIISLNSNEKQAEQVAWLDAALQNNPCRWTITTFHHPIYSSAKSRDNAKLRKLWQPILDKHHVDLVLQGHDHTYARSGMIDAQEDPSIAQNQPIGVTERSEASGTVYVVSVSGPKMYDLDKPYRPQFQRVAEDVQLFQIISIDGAQLRYEARTATGTLYDGFTLNKREGRPNEMIEQIPATPQRVRKPNPSPSVSPGKDVQKENAARR